MKTREIQKKACGIATKVSLICLDILFGQESALHTIIQWTIASLELRTAYSDVQTRLGNCSRMFQVYL
jgi:hypothetical protein